MLTLVLVLFYSLGYLAWWSLGTLLVGGLLLALVHAGAAAGSRRGLAAGFLLLGVFLGCQLLAERHARAIVNAQAEDGRLLDVALSAFPANPVCWSIITVALDHSGEQMILRRGLLSVFPAVAPPADCPAPIGGTVARRDPPPSIAWQWRQEVPLARLRGLQEQDCAMDAWLRFARTPSLSGDRATDARFGPPGAPNFSTLQLSSITSCPFDIPPWGYPRADVLGLVRP